MCVLDVGGIVKAMMVASVLLVVAPAWILRVLTRPSSLREAMAQLSGIPLAARFKNLLLTTLAFAAMWLLMGASFYALVVATDPHLDLALLKQIDALENRHGDDLPGQVRSVLRTALLTGFASSDQIAALFSIHSRTLNRRLHAFGTSFQRLVDEIRFEIARQMLEDSRMDISQIAMTLDYADASAFTRAFRRWSGATPAQWRVNRKAASQRNT